MIRGEETEMNQRIHQLNFVTYNEGYQHRNLLESPAVPILSMEEVIALATFRQANVILVADPWNNGTNFFEFDCTKWIDQK